jgi:hypothetical protein
MTRIAARTITALVAVLLLGAGACSGSDDAAPDSTTTTLAVSTPTTSGRLGDLSDLEGSGAGLTGAALDCYNVQLAVFALAAVPSGYLAGSNQEDLDSLQADLDTLRGQLPAAVTADFDAYVAGIVGYGEAVKGIAVADITNPATQQQIEAASAELDAPEVQTALDGIQRYLAETCPAPTG